MTKPIPRNMRLASERYEKTWPKCYKYSVTFDMETLKKSQFKDMTHEILFDEYGAIARGELWGPYQIIFKRKRDAIMFALRYL